jgi:membrane protein implicated in regulation of membrane protease activity
MAVVYLAALIVGLGIVLLQLVMSSHGDADGASADDGIEIDGHVGGGGHGSDALAHDDGHAIDATGFLALFLSLRFWTFGALAFGLMGSLLHHLGLTSPVATAMVATATGFVSGAFAAWVFRALARSATDSGGQSTDLVGQVGKVLVPLTRGDRGKVRLRVRGQIVDYLATTDEEALEAGANVLVEEVRGERVHVNRVPRELVE